MTYNDADSAEIGIHVTNLYRQLDDLLERPISGVRRLLTAYVTFEAIVEEFALLFTEIGVSSPTMARTHQEAERRCQAVEDRLTGIEKLPEIRQEALQRLADRHPEMTGDPVILAIELERGAGTLGDLRQMVLRQNLVAGDLRPKGVAVVPPAVAQTLARQGIGVIETITGGHDRHHLDAAVVLWEPYDEGSTYEAFSSALHAATLLN